ncbi:hypothetical protein ACFX19_040643 [Malus domestica]
MEMQVIDILLFKAMEELNNITKHAKQRHHIIGQYVVGHQGLVQDLGTKDQGASAFLKDFYKSNYFLFSAVPWIVLPWEFAFRAVK